MASRYRVQIVNEDGKVCASFPPGLDEERDFLDGCVAAITKKGVGVFRTQAAVAQAVRDGLDEVLVTTKARVHP